MRETVKGVYEVGSASTPKGDTQKQKGIKTMILIIRRYGFIEKPTTFDKLGIGTFFITQVQLQSLGNSASVNIKVSSEYAVSLNTGERFMLANCTLVCIGTVLND